MTTANLENVALELVKLAATLAPPIADLLHDATKDRVDPVARRVADILPERSAIDEAIDRMKVTP